MPRPSAPPESAADPRWYQEAIIYQVHVRAFADGDGDGIGDFAGLTGKLDYLARLGVTALWLLPFYPSPLRDDGYDIADYTDVNPSFGDLASFRRFLREAHRRGLRVITELVINHTSDRHPWFQRARRAAPGTVARDFYVWSDTPDRYREARIIFQDFEHSNWSWDPLAKAYYWHRFYHHQPDLNFEQPAVKKAVVKAMDFWLKMGVDGMRLDAVPYLFEAEGTNCENLPATHEFLRELRAHVDTRYADRMLLAEANQWPEDAIAYFGAGDECHMAFHFPVMPRLFMAVHQEDRFPVIDILEQTPAIPAGCQWATFLRNHDELTLEMVTDEDRDFMYRAYAADPRARINLGIRRRLAPLLGNDRRRIELMNALLFSLPGTPVVYYGDEIGMGDNIYLGDRNGVRTPMQWSPDRNAGFSAANPQRLFLPVIVDPQFHFEAVNVATQDANPTSLLCWMRRLIAVRKRFGALARGTIEFLYPRNHRVLAFVRRRGEERVLVVANLSRFVQHVELDLAGAGEEYVGATPIEVFGGNPFPRIGELPYLLTLGPHGFYWFALERDRSETARRAAARRPAPSPDPPGLPELTVAGSWDQVLVGEGREGMARALAADLPRRPWYAGGDRRVRAVTVETEIPVRDGRAGVDARLALVRTDYAEGEPETYALPLAFAHGKAAERLRKRRPEAVVAALTAAGKAGVVYDAAVDPGFARLLLDAVARRRRFRDHEVALAATPTSVFRRLDAERRAGPSGGRPPVVSGAEQSNTSIVYGDALILKLFRRLEPGRNPDLEVGRFLTERSGFAGSPAVAGALELRREGGEPATVGILHAFVANRGDAWELTLGALKKFFAGVRRGGGRRPNLPAGGPLDWSARTPSERALGLLGRYPALARRLGERTAELHRALAGSPDGDGDPAFTPEPFTRLYQRSVYQSMRTLTSRTLQLLGRSLDRLSPESLARAQRLLHDQARIHERFGVLRSERFDGLRIRVHGDFHLKQALYTGRDFVLIDFEGEPERPLSERRIKRSPLADVAGMLRSFHYAARTALVALAADTGEPPGGKVGTTLSRRSAEAWAAAWYRWIAGAYLGAYLERVAGWSGLPASRDRLAALLDVYLLGRALGELAFELGHRPRWIDVALTGVVELMEGW